MKYLPQLLSFILSLLVGTGCATNTVFTSTFLDVEAAAVDRLEDKKVVVLVFAEDNVVRQQAESAMTAFLVGQGVNAVSGYTVIPDLPTRRVARELLKKTDFDGAVAICPISDEANPDVTPAEPTWVDYWNKPQPGAWTGMDGGAKPTVWVETIVWSLNQDKLLWGGISKTTDPGTPDLLVVDVMQACMKQMKDMGIL